MIETVLILIGLLLLLSFDLTLIATRTAFMQTNTARLLAMREQMGLRVTLAMVFVTELPRLRASLNLALVLARFLIAGAALTVLTLQFINLSLLVNAAVLVVLAGMLFGLEWSVERSIARNPEIWALRLSVFVRVWMFFTSGLLSPFFRNTPPPPHPETPGMVTADDLKTMMEVGREDGALELDERRMIYSVFELGDTLVREIMIPRIDVVALDVQTALLQAVDTVLQYGHSRLPIYEETIDQTLGLVYAKDLLRVFREGGQLSSLKDLLRPAYFVPEAKKVDELLAEMQNQRIHMAIIVDEYGGVAGLVTLEDIVEEIVGEIQDEFDQGEEAPYQEVKAGEYIFLGRVDLDDFNEIMGSNLPTNEADTLGGFIYSVLGRVPTIGEKIQKNNLLLTVEQVSARRIRKVRANFLPPDVEESKEDQNADG